MYNKGKRISIPLKTGDKNLANRVLKQIESDMFLGHFDLKSLVKEDISLEDFFKRYFADAETSKKSSTLRNERLYARKFVEFMGNRNIREVNVQILDSWKAEMLRSYSPVSFNIRRRFLHAAFNKAIRWEYLQNNPISKVYAEKVQQRRVYLTPIELAMIFRAVEEDINNPKKKWDQALNTKFKLLLEFLFLTGMRREEALSLKWENVDLESDEIRIEEAKCKRRRDLPMHPSVKAIVLKLGERLFQDLHASTVSHKFTSIRKRAKLSDDFKLHSLRHTFATMLLEGGSDIAAVQNLLGHADIRTTLIYSKPTSKLLKKEIYKLQLPDSGCHEARLGYNLVTVPKKKRRFWSNAN
ncbi:MAG: tyrosine-type recombinase/integrase [Bacteroidota bacterium]